MPHVDEGTLHALLDGELEPAALAEVRVHFATCPSCAARLDEARQLLAETERLVSALELPGGTSQPAPGAAPEAPRAAPRPASPRPAALGGASLASVLLPSDAGLPPLPLDPVVLIPENPTVREVRRGRLRILGWAAGFLVVVGAGFLGVSSYRETPRDTDGRLRLAPEEFTTAPSQSRGEAAARDSAPTVALTDSDPPALKPKTADAEQRPAPAPAARAPAAPERAAPVPPAAAPSRADADRSADEVEEKLGMAKRAALTPDTARTAPPPPAPGAREEVSVSQNAAAEATSELDRRRTRERAAAATAALDRELAERRAAEERERQLAAEREAAALAARTRAPAEDRTGVSSRIGLDEAARQLGGPLHAIDGMSRQTVGLVPGASVDGADPNRPVVRAVYLDRESGTMLFLDQQMARPGDGPATPRTGQGGRQVWVKDGVLLILHGGNLGADSLRNLARRVR